MSIMSVLPLIVPTTLAISRVFAWILLTLDMVNQKKYFYQAKSYQEK